MNLSPEDWKMIGYAVLAGLCCWGYAVKADRDTDREFNSELPGEGGEEG